MPLEQNTEDIIQSDCQKQGMSLDEGPLKSEPLNSMNEQSKVDDKENNNGLGAAQPTAIR